MTNILDEMTKDEIIIWVRQHWFHEKYLPRKSELLWMRYQKEEAKVAAQRDASIKRGKALDMSKRDEYARQFNASKDNHERYALLQKMESYEKAMRAYLDEGLEIIEAERKVDKLYDQVIIEREKEEMAAEAE